MTTTRPVTAPPAQPPAPRPLRRDAELNRRRVLASARTVFAERGLAATLDDVAHHAGLGVGTVYRRFADKDALVEALFEERIHEMVALADDAVTDPDPWTAIVSFLESASERMAQDRGLREAVLSPAHGHAGVAVARRELGPRLRALVARAQACGDLRPDVTDTDLVAMLTSVQVAGDLGSDACPGYWRRHLTVYLDGLRASRQQVTPLTVPALTAEQFGEVVPTRHRGAL